VAEETSIGKMPQVFLREVQTENDTRRLLNYHRILHAWMDEIKSPSPTKSVGENNWTPRWIRPAHDLVVRRLHELDPKFEHNTPMGAACPLPPLPPIVVDAVHVRVIGMNPATGAYRVHVNRSEADARMSEMLPVVFGEGTEVLYGAMPEAPLDECVYQLALVPVGHLDRGPSPKSVAMAAYRRLMAGLPLQRFAQGMVLVNRLVDGMSDGADAVAAARRAAEWAKGGDPFPADVMLLGAAKVSMEADAVRWLGELMRPIDDLEAFRRAEALLRRRFGEVIVSIADPLERERALRALVHEIAEGAKT
jgi:hypothetical protein